jgi:hypothetical protein
MQQQQQGHAVTVDSLGTAVCNLQQIVQFSNVLLLTSFMQDCSSTCHASATLF